jgi:hypothetical protein
VDDLTDDDRRSYFCADLVSMSRLEPGLVHLLGQPAGTWVAVRELYERSGQEVDEVDPNLMATWLNPPPGEGPGYVFVFCLDVESWWSFKAIYNAAWLLGRHPRVAAG